MHTGDWHHADELPNPDCVCACRDATDLEVLQLWLDEFLDAECTNEVFEVQEQFAFGISAELTRLRTAEKVSQHSSKLFTQCWNSSGSSFACHVKSVWPLT